MCGHGCICSNSRAASCVLASSEDSVTGSRPQISQLFFLGAFQQSAGLITCKDYEVIIKQRNLGRERRVEIYLLRLYRDRYSVNAMVLLPYSLLLDRKFSLFYF